jgi:hypothetical protein
MTDPVLPSFSFDPLSATDTAPTITSDGGEAWAEIILAEVTTEVTTVTANDPDSAALIYAIIGGADQGHFQIDPVTGVLTFLTAPDFMAPTDADGQNSYEVEVAASDGTLFDTQAITVYVTGLIGHGAAWEQQGAGDFDGDGDYDILWRHRDGSVALSEMQDGGRVGDHEVQFASSGWQIVTAGDFDGDGDDDILWRNHDGAMVNWEMEDGQYVTNHNLPIVSSSWRVEGVADFDGDGDGDILWRHRDGLLVNWEMEDGRYVINRNLEAAGNSWRIEGTGDLDRDGDADLLWSNPEGAVVSWEIENGGYVATHRGVVLSDWLM